MFASKSSNSPSISVKSAAGFSSIPILINGDSDNRINGVRNDETDEVFFPWIWLKSFFDVFGDFGGEKDEFIFKNSYR